MVFGLFLVFLGTLFLLQNLGFITADVWEIFWPLAIVAFGICIIFGRKKKHPWCCWHGEKGGKKEGKTSKWEDKE